ncbi:MAG: branched-chain amino acid ABC transporter permease [Burkholderiales bacterium]
MSASLVVQAILSGGTNGVIYALVGMGLAVIFKGSRVINAAQGEFSLVGAVIAVFAMKAAGFPYPVAFVVGALAGALMGIVVDVCLIRPMIRRHAEEDAFLLLTIGLAFAISAAILFFAGRDYFTLPTIGPDGVAILFDATIRFHAISIIVICAAIVVALRFFYRKTSFGLAMMAASIDADGAATTGINVQAMRTATYAMGGLLGALAGILVAPLVPISYEMGLVFTLKGFCAAMIGGLTNPMGAIVGGLILGLVESLAIVFIASAYKDVVALGVLLVIMILAPQGLLGRAGSRGG